MKLQKLTIENFHCFQNAEFEFADQTTVFIGKNGTGKSSMIKAVCDSLSFIFNKSSNSWGFASLANEVTDLGIASINVREIYRNGQRADYVSLTGVACMKAIDGQTDINDPELLLDWELRKKSFEKSTLQNSLYKQAYIKFRRHLETTDRYPLLAFYCDRYPHVNTNLGANAKAMLNSDSQVGRTWGYYHWDEFTSCTEIWQKRFIRINNRLYQIDRELPETSEEAARETLLKEKASLSKETEYVTHYLKAFTDNNIDGLSDRKGEFKISSVGIDGATDLYIRLTFSDGMQRSWDELPAGLERLFSIVFDIAYRSYILNQGRYAPDGIVLIDELDLHLHPSLQQDVLLRLTTTFPDIQFIIATHSPLIVTNLRQNSRNKVVSMERDGTTYTHTPTGNLFTYDYAHTLYEVMHTKPRNFILTALSERYLRLRQRKKDDKAQEVLEQLKRLVGEDGFVQFQKQLEAELAKS